MFTRSILQRVTKTPAQQLTSSIIPKRSFQMSSKLMSEMDKIWGHPEEGVYSNLPFKVKNRKFIPFSVWYWGVMGFFFAFPFLSSTWQIYKSGGFAKQAE
ncbi:COX8 [Candida theae]|uniref:Cytochrome c oxidase subunit 8, mitochondrial n=1 Tax=Candida theae TaxID=1198502 RepID=A0AAD5BG63_9ASCO|nr:COX8 [Candida theae]KAI5960507.1 COX8 [Candida theae]